MGHNTVFCGVRSETKAATKGGVFRGMRSMKSQIGLICLDNLIQECLSYVSYMFAKMALELDDDRAQKPPGNPMA